MLHSFEALFSRAAPIQKYAYLHKLSKRGEIAYLKNVDISEEIGALRAQFVEVWHSFRSGDVVGGAEVVNMHSRVRPGKHLRTVHGDGAEEAAGDVVDMFTYLQNRPIAA